MYIFIYLYLPVYLYFVLPDTCILFEFCLCISLYLSVSGEKKNCNTWEHISIVFLVHLSQVTRVNQFQSHTVVAKLVLVLPHSITDAESVFCGKT